MALSKISTKHQITIPKQVFEKLALRVGDVVEVVEDEGKVLLVPQRLVPQEPVVKLSEGEQGALFSAKRKIGAIKTDLANSTGLTEEEAAVATKAGLIDAEQRWWWLEAWQRGEREAEQDRLGGRQEEYDSPEQFLESLGTVGDGK